MLDGASHEHVKVKRVLRKKERHITRLRKKMSESLLVRLHIRYHDWLLEKLLHHRRVKSAQVHAVEVPLLPAKKVTINVDSFILKIVNLNLKKVNFLNKSKKA